MVCSSLVVFSIAMNLTSTILRHFLTLLTTISRICFKFLARNFNSWSNLLSISCFPKFPLCPKDNWQLLVRDQVRRSRQRRQHGCNQGDYYLLINLSIIPAVSKCLILMWTVASEIPICLAISTNGNDESLLKMRTIFKLISSRIIPSTTRI